MWLTKTWGLLFAACSNSGSGDLACTFHDADDERIDLLVALPLRLRCYESIPGKRHFDPSDMKRYDVKKSRQHESCQGILITKP